MLLFASDYNRSVYYMAHRTNTTSMEDFAKELVDYLLEHHSQISVVSVDVERKAWSNIIKSNNVRHPTSFILTSNELQLTTVKRSRQGAFTIVSGLKNLTLMKTADSSFTGFYKDPLTTLPETTDRLFGTNMEVHWPYDDTSTVLDFDKTREQIRGIIIDVFADHESASIQHTLHAIGKCVLEQVKLIIKISLIMPNIHCFPADLTSFGQENKNEIFMSIDDPHGYIDCTITRPTTLETNVSENQKH